MNPPMPEGDRETVRDRTVVDQGRTVGPQRQQGDGTAATGRYTFRRALGAGGMGEVLEAVDPALGRPVAFQRLHASAGPSAEARFLREARITAQLAHPNIVPVHELADDAEGNPYYTMKRIEGQSLADLLQQDALPLAGRLQIFVKVCDGVAFAHSRGVIHRDLKPANVMTGEFGEVLVVDWGLSTMRNAECGMRNGEAPSDDPLETQAGTVMGTPAYMSPEQAAGRIEALDRRRDVYSLGAMLYEMLAFVPPFEGQSVQQVLAAVEQGALVPPGKRAPGREIPWELQAVVLKAMAHRPRDRYERVEELQRDVQAFLDGRMLGAARYSAWQVLIRTVRRHRGLVIGLLAVLLAGGSILGLERRRAAKVRAEQIAAHLRAADQAAAGIPAELAGAIERLAGAAWLEFEAGPPPPLSQAQRDTTLAAAWKAVSALDRAMLLAPDDLLLRRRRLQAGRRLGLVALLARDYTLARHAFEDLEQYGATPQQTRRLIDAAGAAETAARRARRRRLETMVREIAGGLGRTRDGREQLLEDQIYEAVSFRERQTVEVLGRALDRQLVALAPRRQAGADRWSRPERDLARFLVTVLARLDLPEAVEPLARWLAVVSDPYLAAEAGEALCLTRRAAAYAPLVAAQRRLRTDSYAWGRIRRLFPRVPRPDDRDAPEPASAAAFNNRGLARQDHGDTDGAIADYPRAIALDPRRAIAYLNRGVAREMKGDIEGAIADCTQAIMLEPRDAAAYVNRGNLRLRQGDADGAIADYTRAIALDPRDAMACCNRGNARWSKGDLDGAIADYTRAIALDPRMAAAYSSRGAVRKRKGDLDGAIADHTRAIDLDPRDPKVHNNRGNAHQARGDLDSAIADHTRAIALDPRWAPSYYNRALARGRRGDLDGAVADFTQAIAADRRMAAAYSGRGDVRRRQGDLAGAIADHTRAIALDPRDPTAFVQRGVAREAQGDRAGAIADLSRAIALDPRDSKAHYYRGVARERKGDLDGALADYTRAIALDPRAGKAYGNRGVVRSKQGDLAGAIADFTRVIALDPRDAMAYRNRGLLRVRQGDLIGALADYDQAIALAPRDAAAHVDRGAVRVRQGDLTGALADYDQAIALAPRDAAAHVERGAVRDRQGDLAGALADYTWAIALDPRRAAAYRYRGSTRARQGDVAGAIADLSRAIALAPRNALAYRNRAVLRQRTGDVDGAIADLTQAIALDPRNAAGHFKRGIARERKGDFSGAIADYSRAIALDPRQVAAHHNRGIARARQGDLDGAIADLTRAIALDPRLWQAWLNRGLALAARGRREEARESLSRALELAPTSAKQRIRTMLERLGR